MGANYARNIVHNEDQVCLEVSQIGDHTGLEHLKIFKFVFYQRHTLQVRFDWLKLCAIKSEYFGQTRFDLKCTRFVEYDF